MKENRILSYRPSHLTAEDAEVRAEAAEHLFLCVPLRKPLVSLRLENNLDSHRTFLAGLLVALALTLTFSCPVFSQSRATLGRSSHIGLLTGHRFSKMPRLLIDRFISGFIVLMA